MVLLQMAVVSQQAAITDTATVVSEQGSNVP